ncbi:phosphopantetheine-binding protein [Fulvivirga maritima]|uniref:acyl carrier protein n=1 Tax=Fulvivirga maritima TaxID=2904247 RepID=UPI001F201B4F|nr:phosphopantetheine-binding protein [Fulvivirga maritima]UII24742.1 phosphopantetheine-binding protein [Fulvivirga maritima]
MDIVKTLTGRNEILEEMKSIIADVIGEEFVEDMDITEESSFTSDLEMDSIEIVSFSEKVKESFGKDIDFTGWLTNKNLEEIIEMKLKDVIDFIQSCQ